MRSFGLTGIDLQERDLDILEGLFECRVMTLAHITDFYFPGRAEMAKKRVQRLKAAGLLRERPRTVGDKSILHIGIKSFAVLHQSGRLERYPAIQPKHFEKRGQLSDLTLRHELEVMDVRAAFFSALRGRSHLSIGEFSTCPALYQFTAWHQSAALGRREVLVKPDAFLRVREEAVEGTFDHLFFLEVDRSTESQEVILRKAACYLAYYQSGGLALRFGAQPDEYRDFPFRVLFTCKSRQRMENIARCLLTHNPPILTLFWFALTMDMENCLNPIWLRPRDYQTLIATPIALFKTHIPPKLT